ncbi:MAG: hypothetical protein HN590_04570 [Calditrichaeota bacterium]|jgi:hypothetical protein|nr:hypothetical protein [Deltaproteobacteria bacterium]MBT7616541.1 hypothetical protein [Calditrichota bacterium]MBT4266772.1 hypothetical protein [Deltaproteobacteria bacterium]MBT4643736.1 hypothetical protein [Deltaproteobacteria bacterium]MBT7151980.1 hypothetical protein [Deltaproteobacteria bacterium]
MTILNVELEDTLSGAQVAQIIDLLSIIRGVARVTGDESYQRAALNPPEPRGSLVPSGRPNQEIDLDHLSPAQKKHIISQAIAWGSRNGKITLNILERLSPEEMLGLATKFLGDMADDEKDVIFRKMT